MKPFEHYIYILECGDGSLYTGYTTDVEARLSAHQAGTGAKYTKSHAPVRLIAQARFYSKERAMSAEAHFKQQMCIRDSFNGVGDLLIIHHEPFHRTIAKHSSAGALAKSEIVPFAPRASIYFTVREPDRGVRQ